MSACIKRKFAGLRWVVTSSTKLAGSGAVAIRQAIVSERHKSYCEGCLCEEMGLGKTIEVLACVLTHRNSHPVAPKPLRARVKALPKTSCVDCNACGTRAANPEDPRVQHHKGLWLECDGCHAWMHGSCIGVNHEAQVPDTLVCAGCMRDLCCAEVPGVSKATLIVCPEAIQKQARRHTLPHICRSVQRATLELRCTPLMIPAYAWPLTRRPRSTSGAACKHGTCMYAQRTTTHSAHNLKLRAVVRGDPQARGAGRAQGGRVPRPEVVPPLLRARCASAAPGACV